MLASPSFHDILSTFGLSVAESLIDEEKRGKVAHNVV
jgi:hypothetical protein